MGPLLEVSFSRQKRLKRTFQSKLLDILILKSLNKFWSILSTFEPIWSNFEPILTSFIHFGQVWSNLNTFDPFQSSRIHYRHIWTNLDKFDNIWQAWTSFDKFELLWTSSIHFEQVWTSLVNVSPIPDKFEAFWKSLHQFRPVWTNLDKFELIWEPFVLCYFLTERWISQIKASVSLHDTSTIKTFLKFDHFSSGKYWHCITFQGLKKITLNSYSSVSNRSPGHSYYFFTFFIPGSPY